MPRQPPRENLPELPCACATLRRADRAVTTLYDDELRATGFRTTQFTLLQVLRLAGSVTQGRLGEMLALDSTTLTRSLAPLVRRGLIEARPGTDRRERLLGLTAKGLRQNERLTVHWERAQGRLRRELGARDWETLRALLDRVASIARSSGTTQPRGRSRSR
jgi:DNA-binding MarR family transcriptional regulator